MLAAHGAAFHPVIPSERGAAPSDVEGGAS